MIFLWWAIKHDQYEQKEGNIMCYDSKNSWYLKQYSFRLSSNGTTLSKQFSSKFQLL